MNILAVAFRNVGRNKRRSILSAATIAIATAVTVLMFALIEGLIVDMESTTYRMETGQVRIRTKAFDENAMLNQLNLGIRDVSAVVETVRALPETLALVPRIPFPTLLYKNGKTYKARGEGIDVPGEETYQQLSRNLVQGRMPAMGTRETALAMGLAANMGLGIGDKFTVWTGTASGGTNAMTFTVVGLMRFTVSSYNRFLFFAPLDTVQRLLGMPNAAVEVVTILSKGVDPDKAAAAFASALGTLGRGELAASSWMKVGVWYQYLKLANSLYTIFALAFILLGSTVVINTTMMTVYERVREIGTMSALGMTGGRIVALFFLESLCIGIAGSLAGVLVGAAMTWPLSVNGLDYSEMMKNLDIGMSSVFYPILNAKSVLLSFVYSAALTAAVSIIPSRRASRVEPVRALRAI
jgi:putative ABC transport system permease protein